MAGKTTVLLCTLYVYICICMYVCVCVCVCVYLCVCVYISVCVCMCVYIYIYIYIYIICQITYRMANMFVSVLQTRWVMLCASMIICLYFNVILKEGRKCFI